MKKLPRNYISFLTLEETLHAKHELQSFLQDYLIDSFNLIQLDAPITAFKRALFKSGNDTVNRPINFDISSSNDVLELFKDFDKWKMYYLYKQKLNEKYNGLLTNVDYIRRDIDEVTNVNSILQEDLDVELVIDESNYKFDHFLIYVKKTFEAILATQARLHEVSKNKVSEAIPYKYDVHEWKSLKASNLNLTDEDLLIATVKSRGIIFVYNGSTCSLADRFNWNNIPDLNNRELQGSFLVYNSHSKEVYSIASVYMRVSSKTLADQVEESKKQYLKENNINHLILEKALPLTVGIKFHKAKLYTHLMQKCHIAEVQAQIWSEEIEDKFKQHNIDFL